VASLSGNPTNRELEIRFTQFNVGWIIIRSCLTLKEMRQSIENIERPLALFLIAVVLTLLLFLGWACWRAKSLAKGFDKITVGATENDVFRLMGSPKKVLKCGEFFGPFPEEELGCTKEFLYPSPFAPALPEYYVVRFDTNNLVKNTYLFSSP